MRKLKRTLALACTLALAGSSLFGCGGNQSSEEETETAAVAEEKTETEAAVETEDEVTTIRIAFPEEPATLDTMLNTVDNAVRLGQQIFECLYVYDAGMNLQPMLV